MVFGNLYVNQEIIVVGRTDETGDELNSFLLFGMCEKMPSFYSFPSCSVPCSQINFEYNKFTPTRREIYTGF